MDDLMLNVRNIGYASICIGLWYQYYWLRSRGIRTRKITLSAVFHFSFVFWWSTIVTFKIPINTRVFDFILLFTGIYMIYVLFAEVIISFVSELKNIKENNYND